MAQALPRYCPRCGTPTRVGMRYCATCELPVEAMLSRPGDTQSWSGGNAEAAQRGAIPEPAVIPTPRYMQQGEQPVRAPMQSMSQDFMPTWDVSAEDTRITHFSPTWDVSVEDTRTTHVPPSSPGTWNAPDNSPIPPAEWDEQGNEPGNQNIPPWAASQAEPHFSPAPDSWNVPNSPPAGFGAQTFRAAQAEPMGPPPQAPWAAQAEPAGVPPQTPWNVQAEPMGPPSYSPAPQPTKRRRTGFIVVLLVVLLVLGGGGYLAFALSGGHFLGLGNSQSTIKTSNLNLALTYAGMDVTLVNVQQAQNFLDDPQSASDGMLRLNLQEQNKTTVPINWSYGTSAHLIVQGKSALAPIYVKSKQSIAPGATQTSEIDFAVSNGGNLSTLVFQLGAANEAQMQIPLAGQPNLSQYQSKTTSQNGALVYFGLNWTLTGSTTSLSIPGQQASKGMEYLTLNFKIDSTLSQEAISGSPFDYMRVKAGGQTSAPVATTVPVSFATGETGKTGTATFLIPQNSTAGTLILLSQDPGGSGQATTNFQL